MHSQMFSGWFSCFSFVCLLGGGGGEVKVNAGCASRLVKRALDLAVTETVVWLCVQR